MPTYQFMTPDRVVRTRTTRNDKGYQFAVMTERNKRTHYSAPWFLYSCHQTKAEADASALEVGARCKVNTAVVPRHA